MRAFRLGRYRPWIEERLKLSGNPAGLRVDDFIGQCEIGPDRRRILMGTYICATITGPNVAIIILFGAFGFYTPVISLNQAVREHQRELDFGIVTDRTSMPRTQRIIDDLEQSLSELESVAGVSA